MTTNESDTIPKFQTVDILSTNKFAKSAKAKGKSKEYINKQLRGLVCPHGRKHCGICNRNKLNEKNGEVNG